MRAIIVWGTHETKHTLAAHSPVPAPWELGWSKITKCLETLGLTLQMIAKGVTKKLFYGGNSDKCDLEAALIRFLKIVDFS